MFVCLWLTWVVGSLCGRCYHKSCYYHLCFSLVSLRHRFCSFVDIFRLCVSFCIFTRLLYIDIFLALCLVVIVLHRVASLRVSFQFCLVPVHFFAAIFVSSWRFSVSVSPCFRDILTWKLSGSDLSVAIHWPPVVYTRDQSFVWGDLNAGSITRF